MADFLFADTKMYCVLLVSYKIRGTIGVQEVNEVNSSGATLLIHLVLLIVVKRSEKIRSD